VPPHLEVRRGITYRALSVAIEAGWHCAVLGGTVADERKFRILLAIGPVMGQRSAPLI
jgi:hypothetical protein